ncbi:Chaperone protein YajL [Porphyromonas cangingivalis]|nr:Chaperone protein YajL [Porphyromonas cangingivalis]
MKALLFFANGFEETEAIGTLDVLLRGGIDVRTVSITDDLTVEGAHGQKVIANTTISEVKDELVDALVLPGGCRVRPILQNALCSETC